MLLSVPAPTTIASTCGDAIATLRASTQSILQYHASGTFRTVILPLEHAMSAADDILAPNRFAASVSDDHATREASLQCDNDAERAIAQIESDPDLYATVAAASKSAKQPLDRRLAHAWLARLKRAGATIAPAYRSEFQAHEDELFDLKLRYAIAPNPALFERAVTLRDRLAHLLGYESWAAYRLNGTLAKTPSRVLAFLEQTSAALPAVGDDAATRDAARQYFPATRTLSATLDVFHLLLGIDFRKVDEQLWSPDASAYDVFDHDTQAELGTLYTELRVHRCDSDCITFMALPPHAAALVANLERPARGAPPTFTHADVVALFHGLGSAMTTLLATAPYRTLDDDDPADFADVPAQVLEALAWQPAVLAKIGSQWKTGAPIPASVIDGIVGARASVISASTAHALSDAVFDLRASRGDRISDDAVRHADGTLLAKLMSGEDARMYATLWAQAEATQLVAAFASDALDPAVGARFRASILAPAGSQDPATEIANFTRP